MSGCPRRRRDGLAGRLLYGIDDLVVAGAAAEVTHEPLFDLVLSRLGVLVQQRLGGDNLARGADAALEATAIDECLLDGMEVVRRADALDRGDLGSVRLYGQREAGRHDAAVERDGTGAADADAAGFLGTGEAKVVA